MLSRKVALLFGYTLSLCLCFVHACDSLCGPVTPVSATISEPCPVTLLTAHMQPTLEGQVLPVDLEPRTIVVGWSRSCDGLTVTVELPTFGPETADRKQDPQLVHR